MKHLMLDLETLGNESNSVIVSIGALPFDLNTGETGTPFYAELDIDEQLEKGLKMNSSTVKWWMSQSEEARKKIYLSEGGHIIDILGDLETFYIKNGLPFIWGNGARFDIGLLTDLCSAFKFTPFWSFRAEMDYRSFKGLYPDYFKIPFKGVQHDPVADCYHQVSCLTSLFRDLKIVKQPQEKIEVV